MNLTNVLNIYEKALSAKVNFEKSEGYLLGYCQGRALLCFQEKLNAKEGV